jgi:ribonuclease Z
MKARYLIPALLLCVFAVLWTQKDALLTALIQRGMERTLGTDRAAQLDDGLHLALCGAGGPMPAPSASGPCVAVVAGPYLFVVDSGSDSPRNLARMGFQTGSVDAVLLTHFHSDHIDGLGELATFRWAAGQDLSPLPVFGPPGVETVVDGFNRAYSQDFIYRQAHHGDEVAPLSAAGLAARVFDRPAADELITVFSEDGVLIEAFTVDHDPAEPAVGYRFSYMDRSLLITGDTVKMDAIRVFAQGIDLLVHEALAPNLVALMHEAATKVGNTNLARITTDIPDYHASPMDAAETARDAGVGHLLYYHIVPPLIVPGQAALYLDGADEVFPDYTIGVDGVQFSLPAGSKEIVLTRDGL